MPIDGCRNCYKEKEEIREMTPANTHKKL